MKLGTLLNCKHECSAKAHETDKPDKCCSCSMVQYIASLVLAYIGFLHKHRLQNTQFYVYILQRNKRLKKFAHGLADAFFS